MTEFDHTLLDDLGDDAVQGIVRDVSAAVRQEIDAATARGTVVELSEGQLLADLGAEQVWSYSTDADLAPAPETPGRVVLDDGESALATVVAVGDDTIVVSIERGLVQGNISLPAAAKLVLNVPVVYEALLDRLAELASGGAANTDLLEQILDPGAYEPANDGGQGQMPQPPDAEADQLTAAARAIDPGLRFTWGPPGTGKTRVLATAAADAVRRGDRVLVLAHANAAVDVAVEQVAMMLGEAGDAADGTPDDAVVRVGTPHPAALSDPHGSHVVSAAARRNPELAARARELNERRSELSDAARSVEDRGIRSRLAGELAEVRGELAAIDRRLRSDASDLVDDAKVVATTLSRMMLDDQLWYAEFDVVIVDEASMAPLPMVMALALRGADTLSLFGDFRQLPPIALSEEPQARHWFARDIFEHADVVAVHEQGLVDPRVCTLRVQHRMGEQICSVVNDLAYDGMLRTSFGARDRAVALAEASPGRGLELVVVDTSCVGALCSLEVVPGSWSRVNPASAGIAIHIAEDLVAGGFESVGVVTPYRAQALLASGIANHIEAVDVATIHRFQGSERDAIVFDLTDSEGIDGPSMLTGRDPDQARRLLTVAASRARGKFVVVAEVDFVERTYPLGSPVRVVFDHMERAGSETVAAQDLMDFDAGPRDGRHVTWATGWASCVADHLRRLGEQHGAAPDVELNVPSPAAAGGWLTDLLVELGSMHRIVLRCPPPVARAVEGSEVEVRLALRGRQPWVVFGDQTVVVGAHDDTGPTMVVTGRNAVRAFRRAIAPSV